mmetsp:Transcript_45211/g.129097  ORF Transcript_45211/g.129097 Transcript_45211/m.129097 type:complete len:225 (-) Transcript_45211:366-1040(-)
MQAADNGRGVLVGMQPEVPVAVKTNRAVARRDGHGQSGLCAARRGLHGGNRALPEAADVQVLPIAQRAGGCQRDRLLDSPGDGSVAAGEGDGGEVATGALGVGYERVQDVPRQGQAVRIPARSPPWEHARIGHCSETIGGAAGVDKSGLDEVQVVVEEGGIVLIVRKGKRIPRTAARLVPDEDVRARVRGRPLLPTLGACCGSVGGILELLPEVGHKECLDVQS